MGATFDVSAKANIAAVPVMASVGRRWQTFAEMVEDLEDPDFHDCAPVLILECHGGNSEAMIQEIWEAPRLVATPLPPPPEPWARHFRESWRMETRVWRGAWCEMRRSGDPWWWDVSVRSPLLPPDNPAGGDGTPLAGEQRAVESCPRDIVAELPPDEALVFFAETSAVASIAAALPRCAWLFLLLTANGRPYGILAINDVRIVEYTGGTGAEGAVAPPTSGPGAAPASFMESPARGLRSLAALWRGLMASALSARWPRSHRS